MNVQAYILNISGVKTLEELMDMEGGQFMHTVEAVLNETECALYTAPRWIMDGDIVFFYHAKTAKQDNHSLRRYIEKHISQFKDGCEKYLFDYLDYFDKLYEKYGGKIYAVGKVCGDAKYSEVQYEHPHFKTRIFAPIGKIKELDYTVSADKFKEFLPISRQTGVTPVLGNDFMKLKSLVLRYNDIPYLENCKSASTPLKEVKVGNWLQAANENKRRYLLEWQFRKYYTDFFLMSICDDGKIYSECSCYKENGLSGIADNCILINGKYLFVEIKLNIEIEKDLLGQIEKYCNVSKSKINGKSSINREIIYQNNVLVIDTNKVFVYYSDSKDLKTIAHLDNIRCMAQIRKLKNEIAEILR